MTSFEKCAIITDEICAKVEPGKKMMQKLLYLIERKGVQLDLNYSIHYYGPYSAKLDTTLHTLESFGAIQIDTSGMTHVIRKGAEPMTATLDDSDQATVDFVLGKFLGKTALELEALTTLDYAANSILKSKRNDQDIIDEVIKIKGSKFPKSYLQEELSVLKGTGYVE